jgi:hypothetical protein
MNMTFAMEGVWGDFIGGSSGYSMKSFLPFVLAHRP